MNDPKVAPLPEIASPDDADKAFVVAVYPDAEALMFHGHWVTMKRPTDARHFTYGAFCEAVAWNHARKRIELEQEIASLKAVAAPVPLGEPAQKCSCGAWICQSCLCCSSDCGCAEPKIPKCNPLVVTKGGEIMADQKAGLAEFVEACGRPVELQDLRNLLKVRDKTQRSTECRVDLLDKFLSELFELRNAALATKAVPNDFELNCAKGVVGYMFEHFYPEIETPNILADVGGLLTQISNMTIGLQRKAVTLGEGELPPLDVTAEDVRETEKVWSVFVRDFPQYRDADAELQKNIKSAWNYLNCRERQLLQLLQRKRDWQQVLSEKEDFINAQEDELREKETALSDWKGNYERLKAIALSDRAELSRLRSQEGPEDAWKRGFWAGLVAASEDIEDEDEDHFQEMVLAIRGNILTLQIPPYTPPTT